MKGYIDVREPSVNHFSVVVQCIGLKRPHVIAAYFPNNLDALEMEVARCQAVYHLPIVNHTNHKLQSTK